MNQQNGYWEPITATIDWCENNYELTRFVAEFWNALSSLAISAISLFGLLFVLSYNLERRFMVIHAIVIIIGLGSALFHGTLLYSAQMWDEIPMMWAVLSMFYQVFQLSTPHRKGSLVVRYGMFCYGLLIAGIHYFGRYTIEFQLHFTFLIFVLIARYIYLQKTRPEFSEFSWIARRFIHLYFAALTCWMADTYLCAMITKYLYFNPQFHALWHLITALAIHYGVQYSIAIRLLALNHHPTLKYYFGLPIAVPGEFKIA